MATKAKKKTVAKKATSSTKTTAKKSATKKPATKKPATKKTAVKRPTAKKVAAKKTTSSSSGSAVTRLLKAFQAAKVEAKILLAKESKKLAAAKQVASTNSKKLSVVQDTLKKLEAKGAAAKGGKPSKSHAKQTTSAKTKVKLAEATLKKAQDLHSKTHGVVSSLLDNLKKIEHLEKLVATASKDWKPAVIAKPAATATKSSPKTSKKTSSTKTGASTSKSTGKTNSKKSGVVSGSHAGMSGDDKGAWESFDNKSTNVFGKISDLAAFDSELDDLDSKWRKEESR